MPAIPKVPARYTSSLGRGAIQDDQNLLLTALQAEEPRGPLPPVPPTSEAQCAGWGCLTEAQQAGIIVTIVVVFVVFVLALFFFLRSKKNKKDWVDGDFVLVRQSRRPRATSQASYMNPQHSRFYFRHEGLTGPQLPPQLMITHPTILHIPPPPAPVPVPLPMSIPFPIPYPQPGPIYPMVYQPFNHRMQTQGLDQGQRQHTAPMFPINIPSQQPPQPPRAQQPPPRPWAEGRGHQNTQRPPRRRPSLARRLFDLFNLPVGRASTIVSSNSGSLRAPSIGSSHRSRGSVTTMSTPPLPEAIRGGDILVEMGQATRLDEASPAAATVRSDDFVTPTNLRNMASEPNMAKPASSAQGNLTGHSISSFQQGTSSTGISPVQRQINVNCEPEEGFVIPVSVPQGCSKTEACHSPGNTKPLRSALKNGKQTTRVSEMDANAPTGHLATTTKVDIVNGGDVSPTKATSRLAQAESVSGLLATSSMAVEGSLHRSHRTKPDQRRKHKNMRADAVEKSHQDPLGAAPRAASPIDQVGITVLCSPIGGVEKKQDRGPETVHRQQKARKRIQCLYPGDVKIDEELSDYSPPPSPPRPIHQGGGQYAPSQIRHKQSRDEA